MLFIGIVLVAVALCCLVCYVFEMNSSKEQYNGGHCPECGHKWKGSAKLSDGRTAYACECGYSVVIGVGEEELSGTPVVTTVHVK